MTCRVHVSLAPHDLMAEIQSLRADRDRWMARARKAEDALERVRSDAREIAERYLARESGCKQ